MKKFKIMYFILIILIFCNGCGNNINKIDFSRIQEVDDSSLVEKQVPLRVAFASVISPQETRIAYQILVKELSKELNRPVILIQKKTYDELKTLLSNGETDIAFISTGAYISYKGRVPIELLAMIKTKGTVFYDTYLITAKDSNINNFEDLYYKTFAFTDPSSLSGKLVIDNILATKGINSEEYFYRYFYTYNHDKSVLAVANHLADAASIDSQVYDYIAETNPELIKQIKIIDVLERAPSGPIVIRKGMEEKEIIKGALYNIHNSKKVKEALNAVMIEQFVKPDGELYEKLKKKYNMDN